MSAIDVGSAASRSNPARAARPVHRERGDVTPGFVPADPAEFFDPARVRAVLAHHEAGHVLLAYFHGVLLSRFRYLQLGAHLSGGVKYEIAVTW